MAAEIFDGFVYKFPFSLRTDSENLDFHSLTAESVCSCVQIRFAKNSLSKQNPATGEILVRPKSGQLVEGVRIRGFHTNENGSQIGEKDNVVCGLALQIKINRPLKLSDSYLIVENGNLRKDEIDIEIAKGVLVKSVTGASTEPSMNTKVRSDFSKLVLAADKPLSDGRLYLDFELESQGVRGKVSHEVGFGEKIKTRIVPSTLLFDQDAEKPQQRCLVTSFDFFRGNLEDIHCLVRETEESEWKESSIKPEFATNNLGNTDKAVMRIIIEDKVQLSKFKSWSMRIVDRQRPEIYIDVECRWR